MRQIRKLHNFIEMPLRKGFQRPALGLLFLLYFPAEVIELFPEQIPVTLGKRFQLFE
ncbi:MAG: hypothetical protein MZV70_30485 [Desulfobacterales bacterium]|nr:hypothetical protein [Desulfobacterales bacterium]